MRRIGIVMLILILALASYQLSLNYFMGLKVKGYSYLFRPSEPYDLVIKHALIMDGTGQNDRFRGDIALRDGRIVGVGYVNPQDSPVFDAGGLTFIPYPLGIENHPDILEHTLNGSFPRYPAQEIYLQDPPFRGLNILEAAEVRGVTPEELFKQLNYTLGAEAKILLIPFFYQKGDYSNKELLARLTGYRAIFYARDQEATIEAGCRANFYIFKTNDYSEESLNSLLRKGSLPEPLLKMEGGKFLNP